MLIPGTKSKDSPGDLCESLPPVMVGDKGGHILHAIRKKKKMSDPSGVGEISKHRLIIRRVPTVEKTVFFLL